MTKVWRIRPHDPERIAILSAKRMCRPSSRNCWPAVACTILNRFANFSIRK